MWKKPKSRTVARNAEHLKVTTSSAITMFAEGKIDGAAAQLMIHGEIDATLGALYDFAADLVWYRVQIPEGATASIVLSALDDLRLRAVSLRQDGPRVTGSPANPRSMGPTVVYVVCECPDVHVASEGAVLLTRLGCEVRDWRYGCVRRTVE